MSFEMDSIARESKNRFNRVALAIAAAANPSICTIAVAAVVLLTSETLIAQTYSAHLSGGSETPPVPTTGSGEVTATLNGRTLSVTGTFSGLISDFNPDAAGGSHIHLGYAGQNGGIVLGLTPTLDPDRRGGSFGASGNTFTLDDEHVAALSKRRLYINIHTNDFAGGELRGQLLPESDATFEIPMSGGAAVPVAATTARGSVIAELDGDLLRLSGSFDGLEGSPLRDGSLWAVHVHRAYAGGVGQVSFPLRFLLDPDHKGGVFTAGGNVLRLTPGQIEVLENRGFYIDIHTTNFPSGELRGQVLPTSNLYFSGHLNGLNEVPPNTSGGTGGVATELTDDRLVVTGTFSQLVSPYNPNASGGAHIHSGGPDENGPISIPLVAQLDNPTAGHFFAASSNTFTVASGQIEQLLAGSMYVNVHTLASPGGELRAQLHLSPNNPPAPSSILQPAPGRMTTGGPSNTPFGVDWTPVADPDNDEVVYTWQLSRDEAFSRSELLTDVKVDADSTLTLTQGELDSLLALANLPTGLTRPFYHRIIASDGSGNTAGPSQTLRITRGDLLPPTAANGDIESVKHPTGSDSDSQDPTTSSSFELRGAYPNPFNPSTNIVFDLEREAMIDVDVFDVAGRHVVTVNAGSIAPGASRRISIDAGTLPAGIYLYRIRARLATETMVDTGRMVLLK